MFLLSKFFPKLLKPEKHRGYDSDAAHGGEKPKDYQCKIVLLDDTELNVNSKSTAKAHTVLTKVYDHLNLLERDYFGLRYLDHGSQTHWLDPTKSLSSQLKYGVKHVLYFGVKFYSADPCKLHEEITRYQVFLQVKRDVLQGRLPVSFEMAADLCSMAVQSELGDYDPKRHSEAYTSEFRFVPNQTEELEQRIIAMHRSLVGLVPSVAEYRYLDKAKWLDMYGVDLHPVQGEGSVEYFVGLTPTGVVVYRNKTKVGNYFWPRITKVTFKAKVFMVRVKDKNNDENTYAFECTTKQACKHLWKCCVEHHAFFRLSHGGDIHQRSVGKFFNFGSKYRYSGRTERQALADASNRPQPKVIRTPSRRHQRRFSGSENLPQNNQSNLYQRSLSTGHVEGPVTTVINPEPVKTPSGERKEYQAGDSPRSTRSAPWSSGHHRKGGLYTTGRESPMSVRSEKMMFPTHRRGANSGSESESGYNRRRNRRGDSDNESDISAMRNARRRREAESGSESESCHRQRRRERHSRRSAENLTYSEEKWKNIHTRLRDGRYDGVYDPYNGQLVMPNGSMSSIPASEASHHSQNRRKRRTRSKSPGNKKPPEELAQHFKYVEPEPGLSEDQLRDIPYTAVETTIPISRRKISPHRYRHKSQEIKRKSMGEYSEKSVTYQHQAPPGEDELNRSHVLPREEPPPPYSAPIPPPAAYANRHSQPAYPFYTANHYRNSGDLREAVHPPVSVYKNQTYSAPIVKTKGQDDGIGPGSHYPQHYPGTMIDGPPSHQAIYADQMGNDHTDAGNMMMVKHTRDDSGLGPDQSEGPRMYAGYSEEAYWAASVPPMYSYPQQSYVQSHYDRFLKQQRHSGYEPLTGALFYGPAGAAHSPGMVGCYPPGPSEYGPANNHMPPWALSAKALPYHYYSSVSHHYRRSPASQSGSSRSVPTGPMSPNSQMTPLSYKSASKPVFIEQGLSDGHRSYNHNEGTQGQGHGQQGHQGHNYQPHNLPTPTTQYNGHNRYNAPPSSYGYYTPPYMAKTYAPSPKSMGNSSFGKETTFSSPYKPKPNQSSPIGSLSRGVSSPFKPVVPSVRNTSSKMEHSKHGQILSQNNNVKYNNANGSAKSNHVNGNVNSEVIRQVIASPGTNRDLLTEL